MRLTAGGKEKYFPNSITIEDIDTGVRNALNNGGPLELVIEGKPVSGMFMSAERWGEFSKGWQIVDKDLNLLPPLIIINRESMEKGEYSGVKWNIPGMPKFIYQRVPTFENGRYGEDLYKIPQPYAVDIQYSVRFVARYLRDCNVFCETLLNAFSGDQLYIDVNGYYTRLELLDIEQDDNLDELDVDRIFIFNAKVKASGYLQDERDFEVTKAYNRTIITQEIQGELRVLPSFSGGTS